MTIFETRRARLRSLVDEIAKGNVAVFAARFGYSPAQVSQYLSETYNDGRSIGERVARALEEKVHVPRGWMDQSMGLFTEFDSTSLSVLPFTGTIHSQPEGWVKVKEATDDTKYVQYMGAPLGSYVLLVRGGDLAPRYRSNELIVIDKFGKPKAGQDVLLKYDDGQARILQYLFRNEDELTLQQVSGKGSIVVIEEYLVESISPISAMLVSVETL